MPSDLSTEALRAKVEARKGEGGPPEPDCCVVVNVS